MREYNPIFSIIKVFEQNKKIDGLIIKTGRIDFINENEINNNPISMLKIFYLANKHKVNIHPNAIHLISKNLKIITENLRNNEQANKLFLEILANPDQSSKTLIMLRDSGVLAKFIPEFAKVIGQMQFDMYHIYTVDEHILTAINVLNLIEKHEHIKDLPLATKIMPLVKMKNALYVATLCHDIAKGMGGDHEAKRCVYCCQNCQKIWAKR